MDVFVRVTGGKYVKKSIFDKEVGGEGQGTLELDPPKWNFYLP